MKNAFADVAQTLRNVASTRISLRTGIETTGPPKAGPSYGARIVAVLPPLLGLIQSGNSALLQQLRKLIGLGFKTHS